MLCNTKKWRQPFPNSRDEIIAPLWYSSHILQQLPDILTINYLFILSFNTFYSDPFAFLNLACLPGFCICRWTPHQHFGKHYSWLPDHLSFLATLGGPLMLHTQRSPPCLCLLPLDTPVSQPAINGLAAVALAWDGVHIPPWLLPIPPMCSPAHTVIMPLMCHNYVITPLRAYVTSWLLSDSWHSVHEAVQYTPQMVIDC